MARLILTCVSIACLLWLITNGDEFAGSQSVVSMVSDPAVLRIDQTGTNVQACVRYRNVGHTGARVAEVRPGCGCTDAKFENDIILPGGATDIVFSMDLLRSSRKPTASELTSGVMSVSLAARVSVSDESGGSSRVMTVSAKADTVLPHQFPDTTAVVFSPIVAAQPSATADVRVNVSQSVQRTEIASSIVGMTATLQPVDPPVVDPANGRVPHLLTIHVDRAAVQQHSNGATQLNRAVTLQSTCANGRLLPISIPVTIQLEEPIQLSPRLMMLGPVGVGQAAIRTIRLRNESGINNLEVSVVDEQVDTELMLETSRVSATEFSITGRAHSQRRGRQYLQLLARVDTDASGTIETRIPVCIYINEDSP